MEQDWTHIYLNSLQDAVYCKLSSRTTYADTNRNSVTVLNENGAKVTLKEEDIFETTT